MNTERLLPSLQPVTLGHASQVSHLHSYRNHLLEMVHGEVSFMHLLLPTKIKFGVRKY